MSQLAAFQARRAATHLRSIDTSRRAADTAVHDGDVRELIAHLAAIAHEATLALADLARPARSLQDKADKS